MQKFEKIISELNRLDELIKAKKKYNELKNYFNNDLKRLDTKEKINMHIVVYKNII